MGERNLGPVRGIRYLVAGILNSMGSLYTDRVYGEHPIGLWSFSDHLTYLTLLSMADEDVSSWNDSSATHVASSASYASFIRDRVPQFPGIGGAYKVEGETNGADNYIEVEKFSLITPDEINLTENIDVGFWGFQSGLFDFFEIVLVDNTGAIATINPSAPVEDQTEYAPTRLTMQSDTWVPLYATFPAPETSDDVQELGVRIRAHYPSAGSYSFLLGGISVGQGRGSKIILEDGTNSYQPSKASGLQHYGGITQVVGIPEYGFGRDTAYVVNRDNKLLASNTGIPMVYGDNTSTSVLASDGPSVIFPGKGFLHETGRNSELSLEMWIRLGYTDNVNRKIYGPLWSTDGLYLEGEHLCLHVGSNVVRYQLTGTDGPLLVDIVATKQRITLMVNAVEAGSVQHATKYPDSYNFNTDWIGVYSYGDLSVEIGPVAIYPYVVSPLLAKRRFVWGQGVHTLTNADFVAFSRPYAKYSMVKKLDFDLVVPSYEVIG